MKITLEDIKNYISELKMQRDLIIQNKDYLCNYELQLNWYNKQIDKFETKLNEIINKNK